MRGSIVVAVAALVACGGGGGNGFVTVSGRVTTPAPDGTRAGVGGVTITLVTWVPPDIIVTGVPIVAVNATTDSQGNYILRTQPGTYKLIASVSSIQFFPSEIDALPIMTDVTGQDFLGLRAFAAYLVGGVSAPVLAGNTVHVDGPIHAVTQTDASGVYIVGPAPAGNYTLTASGPAGTFFADGGATAVALPDRLLAGIDFCAAPSGTTPSTISVAGNAASGVPAAQFASTPRNFAQDGPVPGVVSQSGGSWRFAAWYMASGTGTPLGGQISFAGVPAPGVYTQAQAQSAPVFSCAENWLARSFTLTLTSVGAGVPTQIVVTNIGSAGTATEYPVHGTFHADCISSGSTGTVTFDVTF